MNKSNSTYPCPFCAEEIDISAATCCYCGEELDSDRFECCPYCAELIPRENQNICPYCDSPLNPENADAAKPAENLYSVDQSGFAVTITTDYAAAGQKFNDVAGTGNGSGSAGLKLKYPVASILVICVCIIVFILTAPDYIGGIDARKMLECGGVSYESVVNNGEYFRLITALFLHFSVIHLLFNMCVLFPAGRCVENLFGWKNFAIIYLWSGIAGGIATLMFAGHNVVSAGASGAIFGLVGAQLGYLLRHHSRLPVEGRNKMYGSVGSFFAINTIFALGINSVASGWQIGIAAHTGGFAGGILAGLIFKSRMCDTENLSKFADDL